MWRPRLGSVTTVGGGIIVLFLGSLAFNAASDHDHWPGVLDFVRRNRTPAVMMWWHDRDPTLDLNANHKHHRRFSRKFAASQQAAGLPRSRETDV